MATDPDHVARRKAWIDLHFDDTLSREEIFEGAFGLAADLACERGNGINAFGMKVVPDVSVIELEANGTKMPPGSFRVVRHDMVAYVYPARQLTNCGTTSKMATDAQPPAPGTGGASDTYASSVGNFSVKPTRPCDSRRR